MPRWVSERSYLGLAAALFVVLLAINIVLDPARFSPASLGVTVGLASGLMLAAIASMPPILAGRGGIDISVGPLMGLVNVVIVRWLVEGLGIASPFLIVPLVLLLGVLSRNRERVSCNRRPHPADRRHPWHIVALCRGYLTIAAVADRHGPALDQGSGRADIDRAVGTGRGRVAPDQAPALLRAIDVQSAATTAPPIHRVSRSPPVRWLSYVLAGLLASGRRALPDRPDRLRGPEHREHLHSARGFGGRLGRRQSGGRARRPCRSNPGRRRHLPPADRPHLFQRVHVRAADRLWRGADRSGGSELGSPAPAISPPEHRMIALLAKIPRPVAALLIALVIHLVGMALIRGFGSTSASVQCWCWRPFWVSPRSGRPW